MKWLAVLLLCAGCGAFPTHNNEPQSCRERSAFKLANLYPDPAKLNAALDTICGLPPIVTGP